MFLGMTPKKMEMITPPDNAGQVDWTEGTHNFLVAMKHIKGAIQRANVRNQGMGSQCPEPYTYEAGQRGLIAV